MSLRTLILFYSLIIGHITIANTTIAISNKSVVDSLENILFSHKKEDTIKVKLLNELTYKLYNSDKDKALNYVLEAGELATKLNYNKGKATSLRLTGVCYAYKANYPMAVKYYKQAITLSQQIGNSKELALSLNGLGNFYRNKGDFRAALKHYQTALKIFEENGNKERISICYNNIGLVYLRQANYPLALEYIQKSLTINEQLGNEKRVSICLNNIGTIYRKQANYSQALYYFEEALILDKKRGSERGIYIRLNNIGAIYSKQKKYDKAFATYQEALSIIKKLDEKRGLSKCLNNIGVIHRELGEYNKAFEYFQEAMILKKELDDQDGIAVTHFYLGSVYLASHRFHKALDHTLKSLAISDKLGLLEYQKNTHKQLSEIHTMLNQFKPALHHQKQYKIFADSIFNEKKIREIANIESSYIFDKEKQVIELRQQKKEMEYMAEVQKQKVVRNSFILGFLLLVVLVAIIWQSLVQKRKANLLLSKQKKEIEFQAKELKTSNKKLKELDIYKQDITNMIAHDLKAPIGAIINIETIAKEDPELFSIKQSGYIMYNLVMNMLDVYKYEHTTLNLDKSIHSLTTLIRSTFVQVEYMVKLKNITLSIKSNLDYQIELDAYLIKRVVVNILANAIKYCSVNGNIWFEIHKEDRSYVRISIFNDGIPIPPQFQDKIFDRYTHKQETGQFRESTGLGLTFCKMAVEQHDGKIGVNSLPDAPVEFWFTLPCTGKCNAIAEHRDLTQQVDLTHEDIAYLHSKISSIKNIEVYEVSEIIKCINGIEYKNDRVKKWLIETKLAVSGINADRYHQLINKIFNHQN